MKRNAIFLDRDGVLNQVIIRDGKPYPPNTLTELIIPDDVLPALNQLKLSGFMLIGATNQPDVARGKTTRESVQAIHDFLMATLPLDAIFVCYHDDKDNCSCRKPLAGLLLQAAQQYHIALEKSVMIGDRWKDIEAGKKAGCKTLWIQNDYKEPSPPRQPDWIARTMQEATQHIMKHKELL